MLLCRASLQSPWVGTGGPWGRGVINGIKATLRQWLIMCSMHLMGEKILKLWSNKDVVFLSGGECDTPDWALKMIDRLLISTRCISFSWEPILLKTLIFLAILGCVTSWKISPLRTSETRVRWKDLYWSMGPVYSLHE